MGCQEGWRRAGAESGCQAETETLGGWQKSHRRRYQETLGAEARRSCEGELERSQQVGACCAGGPRHRKRACKAIGISLAIPNVPVTRENLQQLDEQGWVALPGTMDNRMLHEIRARVEQLWDEEGENAGAEFRKEQGARRLANLIDKGEVFERVVSHPAVLSAVRHVLGDDFKLSSLNARSTDPWSPDCQPLHCDAGAIADDSGFRVCNTIWLLDDFTPTNGATRIVPGSQHWRKLPQQELADPQAPHPGEVLVVGEAGTVVVMNTHAWHGGTANCTGHPRRALHAFYTRGDQPQQQYQKALLRPETKARLSPELRRILALDEPRNDEISSQITGMSGFLR